MKKVVIGFIVVALALALAGGVAVAYVSLQGSRVVTQALSEPLDGATSARIDIRTGTGNLMVDALGDNDLLASGALEYVEAQGKPDCTRDASDGRATLTLDGKGPGKPSLRLPWAACNAALSWQVHVNPAVPTDITAHSDGGNVRLDLADMSLAGLTADTGGGNVEVVLPDGATDLSVVARTGGGMVSVELGDGMSGANHITAGSGAGNVDVWLPAGIAARVHATSGLGKVTMDGGLVPVSNSTYETPGYDDAANRVELTLQSGAGNESVHISN